MEKRKRYAGFTEKGKARNIRNRKITSKSRSKEGENKAINVNKCDKSCSPEYLILENIPTEFKPSSVCTLI